MSHDDVETRLALAPPVWRGCGENYSGVIVRQAARPLRNWRYWRQQRLAKDGRLVMSEEWTRLQAELDRQRTRMRERYTPADVKHFRALDRVRVKEIELLKARLERAEAQARELEEGNRFLRAQIEVSGSMGRS